MISFSMLGLRQCGDALVREGGGVAPRASGLGASAIGRRSLAGQQLLQSNPLGGFSRLITVCISMYWFCAYFSDLDGALYFCKLSFVSVTLATSRSPVKVGAILLPVSCFISQSEF